MAEHPDGIRHFDWKFPAYAIMAVALTLPPLLLPGRDEAGLLWFFLILPVTAILLLITAARNAKRQKLATIVMLLVYVALLWPRWTYSYDLRTSIRWLAFSRFYKAKTLAQPSLNQPELRHVEWDGWGFPGAGDTVISLVFDPQDSLRDAANRHSPGKFPGIPCEVYSVSRRQAHWYIVHFYTDTDWNHCE